MSTVETNAAHASVRKGAEERIDVLSGDRCCVKCGFNLHGQLIVREPHYGLLIVRCPECGQPAAMQEYPTLTRWVGRVRFALVAVWLLLLLAGIAATGGILYGFTNATASVAIGPYMQQASADWSAWTKANAPAGQTNWYPDNSEMLKWWASLPPEKYFADFGSWSALNWRGLYAWVFVAALLIPAGVLYSVFFARLRGVRLLLPIILPVTFAALLALHDLVANDYRWHILIYQQVWRQVGWLPMLMTLVVGTFCLFAGTLIGRRLVRTILAAMLPVRLLPAVSFLWLADDRPLPRPRASGG